MPSLAETQALFRNAIASDTAHDIDRMLRAPRSAADRLTIYRRHFRESFRRHLRGRYPTLEWLIGTPLMVGLADRLLRQSPPRAPSLAEYGEQLIGLVSEVGADGIPIYAADVAKLDWQLGTIAVEIELSELPISSLSGIPADRLGDLVLGLQPGLAYVSSEWPVDELVRIHLSGTAPNQLHFTAEAVWLELRGARGQFGWRRLTRGEFLFRSELLAGKPLGNAAELALQTEPDLDISAALARLFEERLVMAVGTPSIGDEK